MLEHVPADLHREGGAVRDLHVPGDGQGAEPLQVPGNMILVSSSSSWAGLVVSPDNLLGLVVRHAVHADGVHPGAGEVLAVEHREPAGITVQYSSIPYSSVVIHDPILLPGLYLAR